VDAHQHADNGDHLDAENRREHSPSIRPDLSAEAVRVCYPGQMCKGFNRFLKLRSEAESPESVEVCSSKSFVRPRSEWAFGFL
jgi:hypothetical protein